MVHVAVNKYMTLKKINILEYAFGEGEGVIKKRTLCTLSSMSIIVNHPLQREITKFTILIMSLFVSYAKFMDQQM